MRFYRLKDPAGHATPGKPAPAPASVPSVLSVPSTQPAPRAFAGGLGSGPPASGAAGEHSTAVGGPPSPVNLSAPEPGGPWAPARGDESHPYPSTATQPLGAKERQRLGLLSSQAFHAACTADPDLLPLYIQRGYTATAAASDWRHGQCKAATARHPAGQIDGISHATRAHYKDLEAHFAMLAGDSARAFTAAMHSGTDAFGFLRADSTQARFVLSKVAEAAATHGLHPNYVKAIAAKKPGYPNLTPKQLWQLVFTINNRAAAKQSKHTTPVRGLIPDRNKSQRRGGGFQPPSIP